MLTYSVYRKQALCGTVRAERQGLYWSLQADCVCPEGIHRLYAANADAECCIGVLQMNSSHGVLEKRLSCRTLFLDAQTRFFLREQTVFTPFHGTLCGVSLPNASVCRTEEGEFLAIAFEPEKPFPALSAFCLFCVKRLNGKPYWLLPVKELQTLSQGEA